MKKFVCSVCGYVHEGDFSIAISNSLNCHTDHYKGGYVVNADIDFGAHTDDHIQGNTVELRELGQQSTL